MDYKSKITDPNQVIRTLSRLHLPAQRSTDRVNCASDLCHLLALLGRYAIQSKANGLDLTAHHREDRGPLDTFDVYIFALNRPRAPLPLGKNKHYKPRKQPVFTSRAMVYFGAFASRCRGAPWRRDGVRAPHEWVVS